MTDQTPEFDMLVVFNATQAMPWILVQIQTQETIPLELSAGTNEDFIRACSKGDLEFLKKFENDSTFRQKLDIKGPNGETLFYFAAQHGQLAILQWLHAKKPSFVRQSTHQGATPLYGAILADKFEAAQWIFNNSTSGVQEQKTADGWNIAHLASFTQNTAIVQWIFDTRPQFFLAMTKEDQCQNLTQLSSNYVRDFKHH
jgi:ankyrin repeat protein